MTKEIVRWLNSFSIRISSNYLRLRLESHPDYPSLLSVQDTLEELGIECYACSGTIQQLSLESKPFLAHLNTNGGQIIYCNSLEDAQKRVKNFDTHWSGNVMLIEKQGQIQNTVHDNFRNKEWRYKLFLWVAIALIAAILLILPILNHDYLLLLLTLSCMTGLYISWLIVQKEFGVANDLSERLCSMIKQSHCEAVLNTRGAKILNWLTWSDIGIVFYSASLLILLVSQLLHQPITIFATISVIALLFPFYSVYYQWKVVKQWCTLCLGILIVLVFNSLVLTFLFTWEDSYAVLRASFLKETFTITIAGIIAFSVWQLIKSSYHKNLMTLNNEIKVLRLKRNPHIFNSLMEKQEAKNANLPETNEAIVYGNSSAPTKLVIACSPFCGPCVKAHQAIDSLYEKFPHIIQVAYRFALESNSDNNRKTLIAKEIIKAAKQNPFDAMRDWFKLQDLEQFQQLYGKTKDIDVSFDINTHLNWCTEAKIDSTPTVFLNGRSLPITYSWSEFIEILGYKLKNVA